MSDFALIGLSLLILVGGGTLVVWSCWGLRRALRIPALVYLLSYLVTYVVGAVLISVTQGAIYSDYWGGVRHLPVPLLESPTYWGLLLMPFAVVPLALRLVAGTRPKEADAQTVTAVRVDGVFVPIALFVLAFAVLARNGPYRQAWLDPFSYLQGTVFDMYARRGEILDAMTTGDAAVLYTVGPFLTYLVLQTALETKKRAHFVAAMIMAMVTATGQLALTVGGPTVIFGAGMFFTIVSRGFRRQARWLVVFGIGLGLVAAQYFVFKLGSRTVTGQLLEPIMRMPCVYPYYLLFVEQHGHPGAQLVSLLTAGRLEQRTPWAGIIGSYAASTTSRSMVYTPAPAHVFAYADQGIVYAVVVVLIIVGAMRVCGTIFEARKISAMHLALGTSFLCSIYMTTQHDLVALLFDSWGVLWALIPCGAVLFLNAVWTTASRARVRRPDAHAPAGAR